MTHARARFQPFRLVASAAAVLAALLFGCAYAGSLTPPNLTTQTTVANADLLLVWPSASVGPLQSLTWANAKAQLVTDLGSTWLKPSNNLSDVGNPSIARTNLGLGSASIYNVSTSGANVPLLNVANVWGAAQNHQASASGGVAEPLEVQNSAADAVGNEAGLDLNPSATGCSAIVTGYRDGAVGNTGFHLWSCASASRNIIFQLNHSGDPKFYGNVDGSGAPAVSLGTCGSGSSVLGSSNDNRGTISVAGSPTSCTINFGRAFGQNATCVATMSSSVSTGIAVTVSVTTYFTVTFTAGFNGYFSYICEG